MQPRTVLSRVVIAVAALALLVVAVPPLQRSARSLLPFEGQWRSPDAAAQILIRDREFGMRAVPAVVEFGDAALAPLRKWSSGFAELDNRNSAWLAAALSAIDTERARALAVELFAMEEPRPRLVGAVALAAHGEFPDDDEAYAFLERVATRSERVEGDDHGEPGGPRPQEPEPRGSASGVGGVPGRVRRVDLGGGDRRAVGPSASVRDWTVALLAGGCCALRRGRSGREGVRTQADRVRARDSLGEVRALPREHGGGARGAVGSDAELAQVRAAQRGVRRHSRPASRRLSSAGSAGA